MARCRKLIASARIVRGEMILSLIQVAESLNITTIAQGIETESQIALLTTLKISAMQGYYLGRPSEVI